MAFSLQAIVGSQSINLTNGNPYSLVSARGMAGAPVRRVTARGPAQHGDSDLGYRLNPREVELVIGIQATTDAQLDGYRDALMSIFKPLQSTPIVLRVTRDDGEVRQLDCYTIGNITIDLVPEYRPGHYHRATVRLYAPDPAYYNPVAGTVILGSLTSSTVSLPSNWWLAGGVIGTAQVKEHGTLPTAGQLWSYTTPFGSADTWTIMVRTAYITPGTIRYLFYADNDGGNADVWWRVGTAAYEGVSQLYPDSTLYGGVSDPPSLSPGTINFYLQNDGFMGGSSINLSYIYSPGGRRNTYAYDPIALNGTVRRWRSDGANSAGSRWTNDILAYAVYSPKLVTGQINALNSVLDSTTAGSASVVVPVQYDGDLPEYPIITLQGPIAQPTITNLASGKRISFGTHSIGSGTVITIDTRYGRKSVKEGTISRDYYLTPDSDLAEWSILPNPIAHDGQNIITLSGSAFADPAAVSIVYHSRYSGY